MKLLKVAGCFILLNWTFTHGFAQVQKVLPVARLDSAQSLLKKEVNSNKAQLEAPLKQLAIPHDSTAIKNLARAGKSQMDSLLATAKAPLQQLTGGVNLFAGGKPVTVNQLCAEVDYNYFQDTSGMGLGVFQNMQGAFGYSANYGVALSGMPFMMSVRESNGINTLDYTPFRNFYQFNFNQQQYLETLRAKLLEKVSPEALMNSALSRVNTIRGTYERQLQTEIAHTQDEFSNQYRSTITVPAGATNLSASDMTALRTQLLPASALQKYQQDQVRLQNMITTKDPKTLAADSNYIKTLADVKRYETMENIYTKITAVKKRFEDNPLVKELRSQSLYSPGGLKAYLSDPKNLSQVLDDQGNLSTIQRLFCNISKLDLGQNAVQSGELSMQNVVNTGVNTEFKNKTSTIGMIYGQNNSVNNWQQAGLTSQVTNEYTNLTGFKVGTGTGSPIDQSISVNFFEFNNTANSQLQGNTLSSYLPSPARQDAAISLHSGLQLGEGHSLTVDVSRSFGSFNQGSAADSSGSKTASGGSLFSSAGKANYAGMIDYAGTLLKTDLKLYFKKVGLGYNNPGNALLRSGETQLGAGLARKFLQQRLTIKYDGDYRRQVFDPSGNYIYTALSNKLQMGFKFNRNDRIKLTYQRSDYRSDFYGQPSSTGTNAMLQLDGSYRVTLDHKKIMNTFTVSSQQMSIPFTTGGSYVNNSVLITHTSSFMLGKNLLSLTLLSNRSVDTSYYFNTSLFSSEANYSYSFAGNARMSSGLGYYSNAGWNRQIGIRQQVSAVINGKLNLDLQFGYKKAIQIIRPQLANQLFVSTSLRYTFK